MGQTGESVPDEAFVLRLVHPHQFKPDSARGERLQTSSLKTREYTHPNRPSLYVEALANFDQIVAAKGGFSKHGVIRIQVAKLREWDLKVEYSPDECDIAALKEAHASLIGVNVGNRDELVELLEEYLVRPPVYD